MSETITFKNLLDGSRKKLKEAAKARGKSVHQMLRDWIAALKVTK